MDAATLQRFAPGLSIARCRELEPGLNMAMRLADCNTVQRCAMFLAMTKQESVGYVYTQEIGSDAYLRGQRYWPYIGRTFIQTTWDYNYRSLGKYLHDHGLLDDPEQFVKNPASLADDKWAWYGPLRFWIQDHPRDGYRNLNAAADAGDVLAATHMVNGGEHGLSVRKKYYRQALALGHAILPSSTSTITPAAQKKEYDEMATKAEIAAVVRDELYKAGLTIRNDVKAQAGSLAEAVKGRDDREAVTLQGMAAQIARIEQLLSAGKPST